GTAGEYMFQHAEWNEHLKAEKEAEAEKETGGTETGTETAATETGTDTASTEAAKDTTSTEPAKDTASTEGATGEGDKKAEAKKEEEDKAAWERDEYTYG